MATARERSHSDVQEQAVVDRCSTGDITEELCSPLQTWNTFCPILVGLYSESESCPVVSVSGDPMDCPWGPWNSPGQNTRAGGLSLLQVIFPIQGLNPGLPHCRWILYQLSHKGNPRILEWVVYPFSSRPSQPRNRTGVSYTAGRFLTN